MEANARGVSEPNYQLAVETFEKGIVQGDVASLVYLGEMYEKGLGVDRDLPDAIDYYQQAEKKGSLDAIVNLALLQNVGKGMTKNPKHARERLAYAASKGSARGAKSLRFIESHPFFKTYNPTLLARFTQLAKRGDPHAQVMIYYAAEEGAFGLSKRKENAFVTFLEMGAHQGFADAQFALGLLYSEGKNGYPQNNSKAKTLYELAAKQGKASALNSLGWCYQNGKGVAINLDLAREYYVASAELGYWGASQSLADLDNAQNPRKNAVEPKQPSKHEPELTYAFVKETGLETGRQVGSMIIHEFIGF